MEFAKIYNNIRKTAMCSCCHKVFQINYDETDPIFDRSHVPVAYEIKNTDKADEEWYDYTENFITIRASFQAPCHPNSELIMLDENIADIISVLNKKGYHTVSCCEGHLNVDEYNQQHGQLFWFIMFKKDFNSFWADNKVYKNINQKMLEFNQKYPNSLAINETGYHENNFVLCPYIESENGLIDTKILNDPVSYESMKSYWIDILKKFVDTLPIIEF